MSIADAGSPQNRHHRTPVREGGLDEIEGDKAREKEPALVVENTEGDAGENDDARNQSKITFNVHNESPWEVGFAAIEKEN